MSATRVLRNRMAFLSDALDRSGDLGPAANAAVLGITTAIKTYPTVPQAFYGIIPQRITGTNKEGDPGVFSSELALGVTTQMVALNVGSLAPPQGTMVVCEAVGGRWVFRYDG
jgi:hypothetical protein